MSANRRYQAFFSYVHVPDAPLARALQRQVQRFAKPWYRPHAVRVFRDEASLEATPALWPRLTRAMDASEHFVLFAGPESARRKWVRREIAYWLESREHARDKLLIVLTGGDVVWDDEEGDFDWGATTALAEPLLRGVFEHEPDYVDLRCIDDPERPPLRSDEFEDAVAKLAAALHGRPKDELVSEEARAHRGLMRLVRAVGVLFAVLAAAIWWLARQSFEHGAASERLAGELVRAETQTDEARGLAKEKADEAREAVLATAEARRAELRNLSKVHRENAEQLAAAGEHRDALVHIALAAASAPDVDLVGELLGAYGRIRLETWRTGGAFVGRGGDIGGWPHAVAPSGRLLAGNARPAVTAAALWDVASGSRQATLAFEIGAHPVAMAFGPASDELFTLSKDALRVFAVDSAPRAQRIPIVPELARLAVSPGGRLVAAGGHGGLFLWDRDGPSEAVPLEGGPLDVACVAFSPDGRSLFAGGSRERYRGDAVLERWDVGTRASVGSWSWPETPGIRELLPLEDGGRILLASHSRVLVHDLFSNETVATLEGHRTQVVSLAPSWSGDRLLTGDAGGAAVLWDLSSMEKLRDCARQSGPVTVAFAPGDQHALLVTRARGLVVIDPETGEETFGFRGVSDVVREAAYGSNGRTLICLGADGTVHLLDPASGELRDSVRLPHSSSGLAASLDGLRYATSSGSAVTVFAVGGGTEPRVIPFPDGGVTDLALSADGSTLAVSSTLCDAVALFDVDSGEEVGRFGAAEYGISCLALSVDGRRLAAFENRGAERSLSVYETSGGAEAVEMAVPRYEGLSDLEFGPDGELLAGAGSNGAVHLWVAQNGVALRSFDGHEGSVDSVAFSPDAEMLVSAGKDGTVRVWDATKAFSSSSDDDRLLWRFEGHDGAARARFHPEGRSVLSWGADATVRLWDLGERPEPRGAGLGPGLFVSLTESPRGAVVLRTGGVPFGDQTLYVWAAGAEPRRLATVPSLPPPAATAAPDGTRVALHAEAGNASAPALRMLDAATGEELWERNAGIRPWRFSADGNVLLVSTRTGLALLSADSGEVVRTFQAHGGGPASTPQLLCAELSADGRFVSAGGLSGVAYVWAAADGELIARLEGHTEQISSVLVSGDRSRVFTAETSLFGRPSVVRTFDLESDRELARLEVEGPPLTCLAAHPDGNLLAAGDVEGTIRFWRIGGGEMVHAIEHGERGSIGAIAFSSTGDALVVADSAKPLVTRHPLGRLSSVPVFLTSPVAEEALFWSMWATGRTLAGEEVVPCLAVPRGEFPAFLRSPFGSQLGSRVSAELQLAVQEWSDDRVAAYRARLRAFAQREGERVSAVPLDVLVSRAKAAWDEATRGDGEPAWTVVEEAWSDVLEAAPGHALGHYHRGMARLALERHEEALGDLDRALAKAEAVPALDAAGIQKARADALRALRRYGDALEALRRADEATIWHGLYFDAWMDVVLESGRYREGIDAVESLARPLDASATELRTVLEGLADMLRRMEDAQQGGPRLPVPAVVAVRLDGAAREAGLLAGDLLLSLGDEELHTAADFLDAWRELLGQSEAREGVPLSVQRSGALLRLAIPRKELGASVRTVVARSAR